MPFRFKSLGYTARPIEVSADILRPLLQRVRNIHPEDADFANNLGPEAGHFLSSNSLRALIRDELGDEKVAWEIEENKRFLNRLSSLLPALSDLFNPAQPDNLEGFCSSIDDCCSDYRTSRHRLRKDRQLRETREAAALASERLASALKALGVVERYIEFDYEDFHDLYFRSDEDASFISVGRINENEKHNPYSTFQMLIRQMRVCQAVLKITQARASEDPEKLFIAGNSGKNVIVEYAHMMSLMWNGPAITTTPGSDFALLCSLLFECATGKTDEGLAGAINLYARSPRRKQKEDDEAEFLETELNEDNFESVRRPMRTATQEMEECKKLIGSDLLDDFARALLLSKSKRNPKNIRAASEIYGPFQTRMTQLSDDQLAKIKPITIDNRAAASLDIELGNLRRSIKRSSGTIIDPTLR
jgi:hypothetical protein